MRPEPGLAPGEATVEITMRNGDAFNGRCDHPLGTSENPLSHAQVADKFRACAADMLASDRIDEVAAMVAELETLEDARKLLAILGGPAGRA